MKKIPTITSSLFAVLLLIGAGCDNSTPGVTNTTTDNASSPTNNSTYTPALVSTSTPSPTSVKTFNVTGENFKFNPSQITVKKGEKVKINLTSIGGFHDFVIDEFNTRTAQINSGQSSTVEFTANKTGAFEFYCSVGNHRAMGMVGKLIVQ